MMNIFKKKLQTVKCRFCLEDVDRSNAFVIKYKAKDGNGTIDICNSCANDMNEIINIRDSLYEEEQ